MVLWCADSEPPHNRTTIGWSRRTLAFSPQNARHAYPELSTSKLEGVNSYVPSPSPCLFHSMSSLLNFLTDCGQPGPNNSNGTALSSSSRSLPLSSPKSNLVEYSPPGRFLLAGMTSSNRTSRGAGGIYSRSMSFTYGYTYVRPGICADLYGSTLLQ